MEIHLYIFIITGFVVLCGRLFKQKGEKMGILQEIKQLSHIDKLRVMEALWKDLSGDEEKYDSPAWHEAALGETEKRMNDGIEEVVGWSTAKKNLRKKYE